MNSSNRHFIVAVAIVSSATASLVQAQFTTPLWARPTDLTSAAASRTTYQVFDLYQDDDSNPSNGIAMSRPDAVDLNPNGHASVAETSGQAFVTGAGNIYSPFAVIQMQVAVPSYAPASDTVTRFLVQIQTQGSELVRTGSVDPTVPPPEPAIFDFSRFTINETPLSSLTEFSYVELSRQTDTGQLVRHAFSFAVRSATASSFTLKYRPLESSNSQQYLSLDTFSTVLGDFDFDGDRDAADIDLLLRTSAGPTQPANSLFDLDENRMVNPQANSTASDADVWVRQLEGTEYGDSDLNGAVNFSDLLVLAQNYNGSGTWSSGDFDGDSLVNFNDLLALAQNYGFDGSPTGSFNGDWQQARSVAPEPTLMLSALSATVCLRRRRS